VTRAGCNLFVVTTPRTSTSVAYPVQALGEHAIELEAAILVCMADATPHAVHKLRTESRRIEAQLELIHGLKGVPPYRTKAAKVMRQLEKLRKAAGVVRDLDVQQKLIEDHIPNDSIAAREDRDELQKICKKARKRAARELQELLTKRRKKITKRLEKLLTALEPATELRVQPAELLRMAEATFHGTHALIIRNPSDEHLHGIRKAAKLARYQAELAPGSPQAKLFAKRYKSLQEAGGHWHDWFDLAAIAAEELGDHHATAAHFRDLRERELTAYRKLLEETRTVKN
jgi:CHAD domain-containing protein